jgi:hypothetical protein
MEISDSNEYGRLSKGKKFSEDICFEAWESLIRSNSEYTGDYTYHDHLNNLRQYNRLINEQYIVSACLLLLSMVIDDNAIQILASKGFKIDAKPGKGADERYNKSLESAIQKSNNYNTKVETLYKQIIKATEKSTDTRPVLFEEVLTNLTAAWGQPIGRDITLAGYNSCIKIIKKRDERNRRFNKR